MHFYTAGIFSLISACFVQANTQLDSEWLTNGTLPPLASNNVALQGFNFTNLTGNTVEFFPPNETWQLQMNYSIEYLDQTATGRLSSLYSYALVFPEEQLPWQNESSWTLCAHSLQFPFPDNITNLATPAGADSGDCTPYLGDACVQDYIAAFKNSTFGRAASGCPIPPLWLNIPSCQAQIGHQGVVSIVTSPIMSWISPAIRYFSQNNTFEDTTTGQLINNPDVHGLQSRQVFWKQGPLLSAIGNMTLQQQQASTLQFTAFTQSLANQWVDETDQQYSNRYLSDVRLVCGRANATFNGTLPATSDGGQSNSQVPLMSTLAAVGLLIYALIL